MKNNIANTCVLIAEKKGYHVDKHGNVYLHDKKLNLNISVHNYKRFSISYKNKRMPIYVHKFIAYFKFGDKIFEEGVVIRHLNSNSLDNTWDNIGIGNHSDNMMDIPKEIRQKKAINASYRNRRFDDEKVKEILKDRNNGMTYKMLCEKYDTSKSTLSYLFNNALYAKE